MKFNEYWERLCNANPGLRDPETKMTISVAGFKSQLEKAFLANISEADQKAVADELARVGKKRPENYMDIFTDIFGRGV